MRLLNRILFCLLFLLVISPAISAQQILWQKVIGGAAYDNGMKMLPMEDGNLLIGGVTSSANDLGEGNHGIGEYDILVTKVTQNGVVIWSTVIGGSKHEDFSNMRLTSDGGAIVIGTSDSKDGDAKGNHGLMDFFVAKLDRMGGLEWSHCYGGRGNDQGFDIVPTSRGTYMMVGESGSKDGNIGQNLGMLDCWVAEIDGEGNILEKRVYGGQGNERGRLIEDVGGGRFMIVGSSNKKTRDVKMAYGESDVWIFQISANWDIVWSRAFGGSDFDEAQCLVKNNDGDFIIAGTSFSEDHDNEGLQFHGLGDAWAFKVSPVGNIGWSGMYGGAKPDGVNGIIQTSDNGYLLLGMSSSKELMEPLPGVPTRMYDGFVVKIDSLGKQEFRTAVGGEDMEYLYDAREEKPGQYLCVGFAESTRGHLIETQKDPGNDIWLFRLGEPGMNTLKEPVKPPMYLGGYVLSKRGGRPLKAEIIVTNNDNMEQVTKDYSLEASGTYFSPLGKEGNYSVIFTAPGHMFYGQDLEATRIGSPEVRLDVVLDTLKPGTKVVLRNIYFDVAQWELREGSEPELRRLEYFLRLNPNVKVEISGHTDNTGDSSEKEELSLRRAAKVRDWLLLQGVNGRQMQVAGYGQDKPIADNSTESGRALNRRVEVEIIAVD